uniref:Lysine-specific metallo-endopeptidase domain-containing protein n=1 Tax=Pyrodinium bahamense TaxID=73915 RepID=A0A7S0BCP6_9DINO
MDRDNSGGVKAVAVAELSYFMSATRKSTLAFLKEIGINAGTVDSRWVTDSGSEDMLCQDLCDKVVASIDPYFVPPSSDLGCRMGDDAPVCDIDLSPQTLEAVKFDVNHRDFHAGHPVPHTPAEDYSKGVTEEAGPALSIKGHKIAAGPPPTDVAAEDAKTKVANLFRIYPMVDITFEADSGDEAGGDEAALIEEDGASGKKCAKFCRVFPRDCTNMYKRSCNGCEECLALGGGVPSGESAARPTKPARPSGPASGRPSRPTRPAAPTVASGTPQRPEWYSEVEAVSVKAQAYVARALQLAPQDTRNLMQWFGTTSEKARAKVVTVLNDLSQMLSNVAYRMGPECSPNTYAYVYPYGKKSKNKRGQYVFYLCRLYFRSDEGEQIETLTHEGSHHANAYTDDVDFDGGTAYGRPICKRLARFSPKRALNNADSYCYYINDINGHP